MVLELDEGVPVLEEDGTIPDTEGAAEIATTDNVVAVAEDVLETLIIFHEIASKVHCIFCFTETYLLCI